MNAPVKKSGSYFPAVLSDFFDGDRFFRNPWFEQEFNQTLPAVNIRETNTEFDIEFAAPGYEKKDFNIKVEGNVLTISAEKKNEASDENKRYTRKEFAYTSFSRAFNLPESANSDKVDARYTDGILKLVIPKKEVTGTGAKKEIQVE